MSDDELCLGHSQGCVPSAACECHWLEGDGGHDSCKDGPPLGNGDCDGEGQGVGTGEPGAEGDAERALALLGNGDCDGEGQGVGTGEHGDVVAAGNKGVAERALAGAGASELTYYVSEAIGGLPILATALSRLAASSDILAADSVVNKGEEAVEVARQKLQTLESQVEESMPDLFRPCAQKLRDTINSTCNSGLLDQISLFLKYRDGLQTLVEENYAQVGCLLLLMLNR